MKPSGRSAPPKRPWGSVWRCSLQRSKRTAGRLPSPTRTSSRRSRMPPLALPHPPWESGCRRSCSPTTPVISSNSMTCWPKGPLIVSFNRGHWCEYCELELRAFADAHAEFAARGAQVVSIMPERGEYTRNVRTLTDDTLTVLSDIDNGYALSVGVVMWLGDEVRSLYQTVRPRHRALPGECNLVRADPGNIRVGPQRRYRRTQGGSGLSQPHGHGRNTGDAR